MHEKYKNHIYNSKNNLLEVLVTEEVKNILNEIINMYEDRIMKLNIEKAKKEKEILNKMECDKEKVKKLQSDKIKEIQKEQQKELSLNKKLLISNLYKLKIKYENEVKLCKNNFIFFNEITNKKYDKLIDTYNKAFNEELDIIEKKYNNIINNLDYNKKININNNLLLINKLLKNTKENFPDNYYNNNNIDNIILK